MLHNILINKYRNESHSKGETVKCGPFRNSRDGCINSVPEDSSAEDRHDI